MLGVEGKVLETVYGEDGKQISSFKPPKSRRNKN